MNCRECISLLDEHVEGDLGEEMTGRVLAHIDGCSGCTKEYENLKREHETFLQFFASVEATPALWAAVQTGIEKIPLDRISIHERLRKWLISPLGGTRFKPTSAAFSFGLLILLGTVSIIIYQRPGEDASRSESDRSAETKQAESIANEDGKARDRLVPAIRNGKDGPENEIASVVRNDRKGKSFRRRSFSIDRINQEARTARRGQEPTTDEVVARTERQYLNAIAILSQDIGRRRTQFASDTTSLFEQSIAQINRTIRAARHAVRQQPGDAAAVQYMTAAYEKKVELLREMAAN